MFVFWTQGFSQGTDAGWMWLSQMLRSFAAARKTWVEDLVGDNGSTGGGSD